MVDDYAFGLLTSAESEQFEMHYLTTLRRRQKLLFAQALREFLSTHAP